MSPEKEKVLFESFPLLYSELTYLECGDGWFDLIYDLSEKLEVLIRKYIVENLKDEILPYADQIKEKFGYLRFNMNYYIYDTMDLIEEYVRKTQKVCEICGAKGSISGECWQQCLCDNCRKKD